MEMGSRSVAPSRAWKERLTYGVLFFASSVSILTTLGILFVLLMESVHFFGHVKFADFLFGTQWNALIEPRSFGVLPLVNGTLLIGLTSCLIAIPIGGGAGLFLSEYMTGSRRIVLKSLLEVLAGVPSVVYGFFAVSFITPSLTKIFPDLPVFNALSASIVVAVMVIPTIASISQDAFESVPRHLRDAAYGLGARKFQVASTVVFPAALSGFVAAIILAFSRAIGETMAVTLAAGAVPQAGFDLFAGVQTMTAFIVQVSLGDTPSGSIEYQSMFAVALLLMLMTLGTNLFAQLIVRRFQEGEIK
jgi:phosphate transport system permease protein